MIVLPSLCCATCCAAPSTPLQHPSFAAQVASNDALFALFNKVARNPSLGRTRGSLQRGCSNTAGLFYLCLSAASTSWHRRSTSHMAIVGLQPSSRPLFQLTTMSYPTHCYAALCLAQTLHRAIVAAHGWLWLECIHPKQRKVRQFNIVPRRMGWSRGLSLLGRPCHSLRAALYRSDLYLNSPSHTVLCTKANFPPVKIFSNVSQLIQVAGLHPLVVYRYFDACTRLPRHIALSVRGPTPAACRSSGVILI
ncbi:hypothetical protein BDW02DRAFT_283646 [Decorospora gaudefroyi]|uniref:Uncharacterized protein n=1 Tax=Decorospora gaudefroyi TaxID=184978 RepID=A0A6A5KM88_9PLEO|nr:hypothetical protein BDW02DRAFT_283646 [Decorospora gaudefroyi]